jgi:hypothetical protein
MRRPTFARSGLVALLFAGAAFHALGQAPTRALPKELAGLLPTGATGATGTWSAAGTLGMGQVRADLRGALDCGGKPGVGTISLEIMSQSRQGPTLQMYEQAWRQKGAAAKAAMAHDAEERQKAPLKVSVSAVREEAVPGGTLVYFDHTEGCIQSPRPSHTTASLKGVVQRGGVFVTFDIVLPGTAAQAKALAGEILGNLQKMDFSQVAAK